MEEKGEEEEIKEKGEEEEMEEDGMYQDGGAALAHTQMCTSVIYVFSSSQRRPPVRANPDASLTQPLRRRRRWAAEVSPWRDRGVCLFGSNDVCSSTSLQDTVSLFPLYFAAPPTLWLRP